VSLRYLRVLALLIVAFSISSYAQSLGDVARQLRAERQRSKVPHARVITNDDIASSEHDSALPNEASQDGAGKEGEVAAPAANQTTDTDAATGEPRNGKTGDKARKDPVNEREAQEIETQKRTQEINQRYLERIAAIRAQIKTAQQEMAKLQRDQVESTNEFRQTLGVSPNPATYEQQQRILTEQMEAHRDLIHSLNSQLEDAEESARHAGVPHASD
jgi:hypothetical protein